MQKSGGAGEDGELGAPGSLLLSAYPSHLHPHPHRHLQDPEDAVAARGLRPTPDLGPALLPGPEAGTLSAPGPGCLHSHLLGCLCPLTLLLCCPEIPGQAWQARWAGARQLCPVLGPRNWTPGRTRVSPLPSLSSACSPARSSCPALPSSAPVSVCLFSLLPGLSLPAVPICPYLFPLFLHLFPFSSPVLSNAEQTFPGSCGLCGASICHPRWILDPEWGLPTSLSAVP